MDAPQEGKVQEETDGSSQAAGVTGAGGSAAGSPQLATNVASSDAAGAGSRPIDSGSSHAQSNASLGLLSGGSDVQGSTKSTSSGTNNGSEKTSVLQRGALSPSTSMLPVQTGPSIHLSSYSKSSLPVSSSSSSQSLPPTTSQLLKGKQKENSVPLSPFGQNDMNNSRADKEDSHASATALKAFVRPEAGDTQIAIAATTESHPSSSLPIQTSWPDLPESLSTTSLDNFSLPSEGLFPSDGSDMADLFGPGSAALFEQIRAAMRVSPEASSWAPPPEVPSLEPDHPGTGTAADGDTKRDGNDTDSSDDDDDTDMAFNFDLDAQINAAMESLTESAQATAAAPNKTQTPTTSAAVASATSPAPRVTAEDTTIEDTTIAPETGPTAVQSSEKEGLTAEPADAPKQDKTDSDSDDDNEDTAAVTAQFDLDAMLASAMGQAARAVNNEDTQMTGSKETKADGPRGKTQSAAESPGSSDESDGDDAEPAFDLDAHLRQAMALARQQASLSPGEEVIDVGTPLGDPSSDESSDDEGGFDLDAHIGQALANQLLASVQQQAPLQTVQAPKPIAKEPSPDFLAHDLQNMLQAAMKQAALELEQEQQEQTVQLEGLTLAAEKQAQAFPDQPPQPAPFVPRRFAMPPKPRTRPRVEDDGDPENAFNKSRQAHPQALHTFYKCDFKGCDKVFARLQAFQTHRQGHQGPKPYKCHLCPATFATNQEFQDHSWTHNRTREWKYRCKGCFNLFGDKSMFDSHVSKARDHRCSRGECELQMRPAGARVTMPPIQQTNEHLSRTNHDNYFIQSGFDQSALLAATLVHQMSSLLARQYDRQTSLLGPNDPKIDVNLALRQTFQRAGLTPNETAALATILATVGHARNEGLKASLEEARKTQFEAYKKHQERQRKAALKQIKRERKRLKQEAARAAAQEKKKAALLERKKQAEAQKNGDIPVPQAVMT